MTRYNVKCNGAWVKGPCTKAEAATFVDIQRRKTKGGGLSGRIPPENPAYAASQTWTIEAEK